METPVSPKVTFAVIAAAIVTILVYGIDTFWGVDVPVLIQGALTTIIVGSAGWWRKDRLREVGVAAIAASPDTVVGTIPEVRAAAAE